MLIETKFFDQLNVAELYEILRLRSAVFVVEQNCVYQDIDDKDKDALHIIGRIDNEIVAYARCFPKGIYFDHAAIGRVLIKNTHRGKALGHNLIKTAVEAVEKEFGKQPILISAQTHLSEFYEAHQFKKIGEGYLEDGIPHHKMLRD